MALDVESILGPGGLLNQALDRYEYREQQVQMATAVQRALDKRRPLVVEAATGTGKTLAYLVPAILSGKRVVVSTGTKALQDQLFHKDIPFLQEHFPLDFKAVQLKGRTNYLCKLRFEEMSGNPKFRNRSEATMWPKIKVWAGHTETGDRAEIEGLPDDFATWNDLSVGAEACLGTKCKFYEECFITNMRKHAQDADVIVVNHHLFFADLALRDIGFAEILPEYDAVVFDEAHHVEDVATNHFGLQVSNYRFRELVGDIRRTMESEDVVDDTLDDALYELDKAYKSFFPVLTYGLYDGTYELGPILDGEVGKLVEPEKQVLVEALSDLSRAVGACSKLGEIAERLSERCAELRFELQMILKRDNPKYVYFVTVRDRGMFLQAAPIDLADLLRRKLLNRHDTLIFTSATLATGGNFDFFRQRMGMGSASNTETSKLDTYDIDELILPAVFDYAAQSLLYVPNRLPEPRVEGFVENVAVIVEYLVGITEGRAFVLFTSYSNMNAVWDLVADKIDYPTYKQGEAPKQELLEKFRADTHSVLFATSSFWEGVDVEGESLSLVIIDKLPFANPSDPLTRARIDLIDSSGGNAFMQFSVPSAALTLKQGFGRLIRSANDRGVVAILDSRIAKKRYGRYFLESLPPAPVVWNARDVRDWWKERFGDSTTKPDAADATEAD
jgi:ATP-dependent DNA helicase DinG